jgi:hypothetical protein
MHFEGRKPASKGERREPRRMETLVDPRIPIAIRFWLASLPSGVVSKDPSAWPTYILNDIKEHLGIDAATLAPADIEARLTEALRERDAAYADGKHGSLRIEPTFTEPEFAIDMRQDPPLGDIDSLPPQIDKKDPEIGLLAEKRDDETSESAAEKPAVMPPPIPPEAIPVPPPIPPEADEGQSRESDAERERKTLRIQSATTPEEFVDALRDIGTVPSSIGAVDVERIIEAFDVLATMPDGGKASPLLHLVPSMYGVQDKFLELLDTWVSADALTEEDWNARVRRAKNIEELGEIMEALGDRVQTTDSGSESITDTSEMTASELQVAREDFLIRSLPKKFGIQARARELVGAQRARELVDVDLAGVRNPYQLGAQRRRRLEQEMGRDTQSGEDLVIHNSSEMTAAMVETATVPPPIPQETLNQSKDFVEKSGVEVSPDAARFFEKNLNITAEELRSVEGFDRLSASQQKFIFENMIQLTLGNIKEESARLVSSAVGMRKSEMIGNHGRFLGSVMAGMREVFMSGYTKLKIEKEVAHRMQTGGFAEHGTLLTELVSNIAQYGPRIHENAAGELIVDLVNIRERAIDKTTRDAEWHAMNDLNAVAHEFAKTPSEWRGQTLGVDVGSVFGSAFAGEWKWTRFIKEKVFRTVGKVQESTYAKRESAYENGKRHLESVLRMKGYDDLKIAQTLIDIDSRVHQLQTLQTNPNAVEELAGIQDKNFFIESAKKFFSGPGAYMALGTISRTAGGAALGFIGAPIAAAAVASLRSWNRTAAELRERDRNARAGVADKKAGALNVVSAERAEQTILVNGKPVPNGLTAKLERLLEQVQTAEGHNKKRLMAQLRTRVEYVHDKQRLHRVDYGKSEGRVSRQVALTEALARSLMYLSAEDMASDAEASVRYDLTKKRLKNKLDATERGIIEMRHQGRESDLVKSAITAGSFSFAGALVADYFRSDTRFFGTEASSADGGAAGAIQESATTSLAAEDRIFSGSFDEVQASSEQLAPYTIQRGDTLIGIMRDKVPALQALSEAPQARENATMNILRDLSAKELQDIGITSGNVNTIYAGDSINMEKLNEVILARKGMIERALERFGAAPTDSSALDLVAAPVANEADDAATASVPPLFSGDFEGTPATPVGDVIERTSVSEVAAIAETDETVATVEASTQSAVNETVIAADRVAERKAAFMEAMRERYSSEKNWDRALNMRMSDVAKYENMVVKNPESFAGRAQSIFQFRTALEQAGFDKDASQKLFDRFVQEKLTVRDYFDAVSQAVAQEGDPEKYTKLTQILDPEAMRESLLANWQTTEAVESRTKALQQLFTERARAQDKDSWVGWSQGWQSPFEDKSELKLETTRQQWISDLERFKDALRTHNITFPEGTSISTAEMGRLAAILARKITLKEYEALF